MNILYIKKKANVQNWSDVLDRQFQELQELSKGGVELYEVDTSSVKNILFCLYSLAKLLISNRHQLVYVNHIICAYPCLAGFLFFRGKKVLALHEGEPVLGFRYAMKNRKSLTLKEMLRYTFIFDLPPLFFDDIFILNKQQNLGAKHNYHQVNFLGIDQTTFYPISAGADASGQGVLQLFFPNNPERPEKGYQYLVDSLRDITIPFKLDVGGNYKHKEMNVLYNAADIVFVLSVYETYSMALLEAMATNSRIIVNKSVGLAENMLECRTEKELREYGIYVVDANDAEDIKACISNIYYKHPRSNTLQLLEELKLSESDVNQSLYFKISGLLG